MTASSLVGTIALPIFIILLGIGALVLMSAGALHIVASMQESRARASLTTTKLKALEMADDAVSCAISDAAGDGLNTVSDDTLRRLVEAHELLTSTSVKGLNR